MLSVAPTDGPDGHIQLHASTVSINGVAVACVGPSGAGKSGLALQLMSLGAGLIADDITWLEPAPRGLIAKCPPSIAGQIEAWGVGILKAPAAPPAPLALIVDLGVTETERHPPRRSVVIGGKDITLLHSLKPPHFAAIILHYMLNERVD